MHEQGSGVHAFPSSPVGEQSVSASRSRDRVGTGLKDEALLVRDQRAAARQSIQGKSCCQLEAKADSSIRKHEMGSGRVSTPYYVIKQTDYCVVGG